MGTRTPANTFKCVLEWRVRVGSSFGVGRGGWGKYFNVSSHTDATSDHWPILVSQSGMAIAFYPLFLVGQWAWVVNKNKLQRKFGRLTSQSMRSSAGWHLACLLLGPPLGASPISSEWWGDLADMVRTCAFTLLEDGLFCKIAWCLDWKNRLCKKFYVKKRNSHFLLPALT